MEAQHALLDEVARLVDAGRLRTTLAERMAPISADEPRRAHRLIEGGWSHGKLVLEGWAKRLTSQRAARGVRVGPLRELGSAQAATRPPSTWSTCCCALTSSTPFTAATSRVSRSSAAS